MQVANLDSPEIYGRSTAVSRPIDGRAVYLELPDPSFAPAGKQSERQPAFEGAATERSRHDGSAALDAEGPVDGQPSGRRADRGRGPADQPSERACNSARPSPSSPTR